MEDRLKAEKLYTICTDATTRMTKKKEEKPKTLREISIYNIIAMTPDALKIAGMQGTTLSWGYKLEHTQQALVMTLDQCWYNCGDNVAINVGTMLTNNVGP